AGYALLQFAAWPLLPVLAVALVAGIAGALLIAVFLERLVAGERGQMDAPAYPLPRALARGAGAIPPSGVGEIVFSRGGVRRSEAARSLTGRPIPRNSEVVILRYGRGVAGVRPWAELLEEHDARSRARDAVACAPPASPAAAGETAGQA